MHSNSRTDRIGRRTVVKALAGFGAAAPIGSTAARTAPDDEWPAFEEEAEANGLEVAGTATVEGAKEVVVQDEHAYVATTGTRETEDGVEQFGGLATVDLAEPTAPEPVDRVELPDDEFPTPDTPDVKVEGDIAGLADDSSFPYAGGVAFFDVSDPADVELRSVYHPQAAIHNLFIDGEYAYLVINEPTWIESDEQPVVDRIRPFGETGIEIVDISEPERPARAARWKLKDDLPEYARAGVNYSHDLYVQDGLAYVAYWDAGVIALDVSDPTEPEPVSQFGAAPDADEEIPPLSLGAGQAEFMEVFPRERFYALPGNVHYVEPSPGGDFLYAGEETFLGEPGGIDVWDVGDLDDPRDVARIDAPPGGAEIDPGTEFDPEDREVLLGLHTAHNFDVREERLHSAWYGGGVRVHDVSDPESPAEIASFESEDAAFWTAVAHGDVTVASDIDRGVVVLAEG